MKAYHRRSVAREKLGSLRAACKDLEEVLRLEPKNVTARREMEAIKTRMGSKGVTKLFFLTVLFGKLTFYCNFFK